MTPALFLDRDGVICRDTGYVHRPEQFEFMPGVVEALRHFQERGHLLVVVTNQAGIARGYYTEAQFRELDAWMHAQLRAQGVVLARTYHSPYHPEHGQGAYKRESDCRKPGPGMLLRARDELGIALGESLMIGDQETDVLAGRRAGVRWTVLIADPPPAATVADQVIPAITGLVPLYRRLVEQPAGR
jgi:D-glycero-D-manno-heptose 1,7-bisphosphate phosphatase